MGQKSHLAAALLKPLGSCGSICAKWKPRAVPAAQPALPVGARAGPQSAAQIAVINVAFFDCIKKIEIQHGIRLLRANGCVPGKDGGFDPCKPGCFLTVGRYLGAAGVIYQSTLLPDNSRNLLQRLFMACSWSWFQVRGF